MPQYLIEIFDKQKELIQKFEPIEKQNGLKSFDNIHSYQGQNRLRNGAWRIIEEMGEVLNSYPLHNEEDIQFKEEISDALHFLVEFTIISSFLTVEELPTLTELYEKTYQESNYKDFFSGCSYEKITFAVGHFLESLAMTVNTLKNKPWKKTPRDTNIYLFKSRLEETWYRFIQICIISNIQPEELYNLYMKKHEINQNRIKGGE